MFANCRACSDERHAYLCRLMQIVVPKSGLTVMLEAYLDESGTHRNSPVMCIAGYVLDSEQCKKLDAEFAEVLHKHGLEFFHMGDCAHGAKAFKTLSKPDRIAIARRMIETIKLRVNVGVAVAIAEADYNAVVPEKHRIFLGTAYTYCTQAVLELIGQWADSKDFTGTIAYFFESGHANQSEANCFLHHIMTAPEHKRLQKFYRYGSHTFANKRDIRPLQAADILAWQWLKNHNLRPVKRRMDFLSLMRAPHLFKHLNREQLEAQYKSTLADYRRDVGDPG